MAKQAYKIPASLNSSYSDMEIAIQSKDGIGAKPLPVKVILSYITSAFLCFYAVTHSIIGRGSGGQIALFIILWIILTVQLLRFDKTKRMYIQLLPVVLNYIPKAARHIQVRMRNNAGPFRDIVGIEQIDENGLVTYTDGSFGYWYRVVGSASILLFDADKEAILTRVDSFYRKIGTDCEIIFMTTKEAQKVYRQIAALKERYDNLSVKDPDLLALADKEYKKLREYVGGSFRSIHQYMILKGDNMEALRTAKNVLQSEVDNSVLMLKQCTALYEADINEALRVIYRGVE